MTFKPMLSGKAPESLASVSYPVMVSPKYDGIRAVVRDGVVYSRSMKPIPNQYVQQTFGHLNGFDGELIYGSPTAPDVFRQTTSAVMTIAGKPEVWYYVFDYCPQHRVDDPWHQRIAHVKQDVHSKVIVVPQHACNNADEITKYEEWYLKEGYEGVMIRSPGGLYKEGRSTTREGTLLKLKRFSDSEAVVLGMEEKMHNANEATTNELGRTTRSSHQDNMVPMNTMGALMVRDIKTGVEFNIGSGFDDAERARWWRMNEQAKGTIVTYTYFAIGSKDKPRFPIYKGQRDRIDM